MNVIQCSRRLVHQVKKIELQNGDKMTLTQAFSDFMDEQIFRNNSEKTLEYYRSGIGIFMKWLNNDDIETLTLQTYKNFVIYLNSNPIRKL